MIGSFLTRGLVMVFGYAYPAYECYKTVEKNKPDIEQLRFWCQYWILVALLTVGERIGDAFVSWVPMYSEAKLAFYIYLWYPKTKGTTYVYDSFFRPYVAKHETEIDRNLLELRTRAGDFAVSYWQRAATYGQTRVFDILHYIASQSTPKPSSTQPRQGTRARQPTAPPNRKPAATAQPEAEEPLSPTSSTSSSGQPQEDVAEEENHSSQEPPTEPTTAAAALNAQKTVATQALAETTKPSKQAIESKVARAASLPSTSSNENANPPPEDTVMEEAIRVTRGRLRKTRAASIR
ncbi:hypothetical protein LguiA_006838 [Lonicera macranthoides]